MSWDILVATSRQPDPGAISDLLPDDGSYHASGKLGGPTGNVLVERVRKKGRVPAFTVDGPHDVESEDLPEPLAGAVLAPKFLVEFSASAGSTGRDRTLLKRMARGVARQFDGAVFDPQGDKVLWPTRRPRTFVAPREQERIRYVSLDWLVLGDGSDERLPVELLRTLRTACPEAVPRRYGDYEPLQHRLEPDTEKEFLRLWKELASRELCDGFFWKARSPSFGGSVFFPDVRARYPNGRPVSPPGAVHCWHLSVHFDGRALHGDRRWADAVASLLVLLADRLGAFYATGHVLRNVIARRGVWFDGRSEWISLPSDPFPGLPATPTWLAWFGRAYAPHVAAALEGRASQLPSGAWFFRAGPEPMDADELAGRFPTLPSRLTYTPSETGKWGRLRLVPAEFIPNL